MKTGWAGLVVMLSCFTGCQTVHEVTVDAISDGASSHGETYRLNVAPAIKTTSPEIQRRVEEYVRAALATRGYYEAPPSVTPDMEIDVSYGVGPSQLRYRYKPRDMLAIDLWGKMPPKGGAVAIRVHEKFLKMTARTTANGRVQSSSAKGSEIWSVHLTLEDESAELEPYVAPLTAALVDYVGRGLGEEQKIKIKEAHAQRAVQELTRE